MVNKKFSKHKVGSIKTNFRIYILVFFVLAVAAAIFFRMYNLQVSAHGYYQELASNQHKIYQDLIPKRGEIYAKDGSGYYPVAVNRELALVYAVPREVEDARAEAHELADSLKYCRSNKCLKLFGFVFMLNHIHLIVSSPDMAGFIRDFKRYTSRELHKNISQTEPNILQLFLDENGKYEFWSKTNMPKLIETEKFLYQKMEYIHANPVRKNYVAQSDHWYWSSANPNCEIKVDNIWES